MSEPETVIYRDESGAELNATAATAATAACEAVGVSILFDRSPFQLRSEYDLGVHGIEVVRTEQDEIQITLTRRGEVIGQVEARRREQVRALRDLLAEHDLLGEDREARER